jgi:hypothetical protein
VNGICGTSYLGIGEDAKARKDVVVDGVNKNALSDGPAMAQSNAS